MRLITFIVESGDRAQHWPGQGCGEALTPVCLSKQESDLSGVIQRDGQSAFVLYSQTERGFGFPILLAPAHNPKGKC